MIMTEQETMIAAETEDAQPSSHYLMEWVSWSHAIKRKANTIEEKIFTNFVSYTVCVILELLSLHDFLLWSC